ncbi:hypothetical protein BV25DRAFT_1828597 [Artomyces pyxidatus]|uniref:Uncharacterized protein n=1 Tax=Artomyces pyxidatus TaxID=48021 RepID=A0ACB8SVM9_9AGAM|nr:hypothetical protein BV25DRAFT_1828597 [Artomyces pyxidatus]
MAQARHMHVYIVTSCPRAQIADTDQQCTVLGSPSSEDVGLLPWRIILGFRADRQRLTCDIPSYPTANGILPFALASASAGATDTCTDIAICRTRNTIIWSSLVTILACVWTAVHRNIPAPPRTDESRFARVVSRVLEAAKIVVVTVLVPEWVLAWR